MPSVVELFSPWFFMAVYVAVGIIVGVAVRSLVRFWLRSLSERQKTALSEVLAASLPRPAGVAAFLLVMGAEIRWMPLPSGFSDVLRRFVPLGFGVLAIFVIVRVVLRAIDAYGRSNPDLRSSAGIGRAITWVAGFAASAIYVSDAMGVSLAPILTALGLGSLAIALALQDTLSNFFAGIYLLADKPVSPGDYIRIDTTHEGYVEAIGWRSTQLRTGANNLIIVPNAALSKAVITNFNRPNTRLGVDVRIDVANDTDPERVEAVLLEEAQRAVELDGVLAEPAPTVRFNPGILDGAFGFTVSCQVATHGDQGLVLHALRKRVASRLVREKIPLTVRRG
jgi:small-conductance mechanosensitive channel